MSDSLWPHEPQHARPPYPSPTAGVYPSPCPLSLWCHPTISSSIVPFSSCPQSFPASGSFQMSQLFASGGQNIDVSSFNISPSNEHPGLISFRMDWLDFLAVQGTLKSLSQQHSSKVSILCLCHKTPTSIIHKCIQILTNCSLTLIQLIVPVSLVQERSKKIKIATEGSKSGRYW